MLKKEVKIKELMMRVEMSCYQNYLVERSLGVNITHYSGCRVVNLGLSLNVCLRELSNT